MLFNSYIFLGLVLPVSLAGFALCGRAGRAAAAGWLLLASLVFSGWWNIAFVPVLLVSIALNFAASRLLPRHPLILPAAIAANLAALGWYKYLAALLGFVRLHGGPDIAFAEPALPLGISFFTFTQIGFLLDCHAGLTRRRGLTDYALFVTFFPHLIAGPVLGPRDMPDSPWRLSGADICAGAGFFLIGLLKKTLLADPVSTLAAPGFAHPETMTLLPAWRSALAWSLQLYFDFSGYSDMAIGLARLFGVRFPDNFNSPYKASSAIDYWQRWHISLTRFLMSTVHAPVTMAIMRRRRARGQSVGREAQRTPVGFCAMLALPIAVTMGLAGIWHGAGLTFVVFGLLHAGFLIANHAWRLFGGPNPGLIPSIALTYLCVLTGAVIFRAASMTDAGLLLAAMAGARGIDLVPGPRGAIDCLWLAGLYGIVWFTPNTSQIMAPPHYRPTISWAAAFGAAAALGLLSLGGTGEFLYFQF